MDINKRRKLIIISTVCTTLLLGVIAWIAIPSDPRGPGIDRPEINITTDPDTGDEIVDVPGKDPEPNPLRQTTILGGSQLIDNSSMTYTQYGLTVSVVEEYVKENIGDVDLIKFIPDTIELQASSASGVPSRYGVRVKIDDPDTTLNVTIRLVGLDRVRLSINNPGSPQLGVFDSGILPGVPDEHSDFDAGL